MRDSKKRWMRAIVSVALMVMSISGVSAQSAGEESQEDQAFVQSFYDNDSTAMRRGGQAGMLSTAMMWRASSNDMTKRMGEVRTENGEVGLWMKYYKGKMETGAHMPKFKTSYKAYRLGYDSKVSDRWLVGTSLSFYDGESDYESGGEGNNDVISLSVYGMRTAKCGTYLNLAGNVSYLDNVVGVYNNSAQKLGTDYQTWGASVSAQYGKRFEQKSGFYFDPNVQLTVGRIQGKNYKAKSAWTEATDLYTNLRMTQDDADSMVGRIGFSLGHKKERANYFTRFSLARELSGDLSTDFWSNGERGGAETMDFGSTWYELALGGGLQLGEKTSLYATYEHSFGGDIKEKYRLDGGVKISF